MNRLLTCRQNNSKIGRLAAVSLHRCFLFVSNDRFQELSLFRWNIPKIGAQSHVDSMDFFLNLLKLNWISNSRKIESELLFSSLTFLMWNFPLNQVIQICHPKCLILRNFFWSESGLPLWNWSLHSLFPNHSLESPIPRNKLFVSCCSQKTKIWYDALSLPSFRLASDETKCLPSTCETSKLFCFGCCRCQLNWHLGHH